MRKWLEYRVVTGPNQPEVAHVRVKLKHSTSKEAQIVQEFFENSNHVNRCVSRCSPVCGEAHGAAHRSQPTS